MEEQPIPEEAQCPSCGAKPTDESIVESRLSDTGYLHNDISLECQECGYNDEWVHGVPIGDFDAGDELICNSCGDNYRIHRVVVILSDIYRYANSDGEITDIRVRLMCKCPSCNYYPKPFPTRKLDKDGVALIGHPDITGSREDAKPYGWQE